MRVELKKLQADVGTTFVYITHDQGEAMIMSDFVAVMNSGRFEQIDTPKKLYSDPRSSFVAQFVGENNKFTGLAHKDENARFYIHCGDNKRYLINGGKNFSEGGKIEMFVRPEDIVVNPKPGKENFNILTVTVKALLFDGSNNRLLVTAEDSQNEMIVHPSTVKEFDYIKTGDTIKIGWNAGFSVCFEDSGVKVYGGA
ncbi:MAG: TOBE domain-containing protein [Treponema sp.]|jgi:spermidine/putrescine transport system ATP-binding protein|nr:TOBE domain-containing protein [Treponema sp.]